MKNIAITGISGYVGTRLLNRLDENPDIRKIIGIDVVEPRLKSDKLAFYHRDIRQPFGDIFEENEVTTAVHLAFILRPTRQYSQARDIDIEGMNNLIAACRQAGVKHLIYLSSHTTYGAYRNNPLPLTEESPLRPVPGFQYSGDKIETERMLRESGLSDSGTIVTVLRSCPVMGPNAIGTATTIMFQPWVMVGVAGYDPPMQFVHEDDLVDLLALLIDSPRVGIFNVASNDVLKYSEVAGIMGKKLLKLPGKLLELVISLSWATHLQSASPVSGLEFIKYPPVVSTEELERELGLKFRYSSQEALVSFADALAEKRNF